MKRWRLMLGALSPVALLAAATLFLTPPAHAASLVEVTSFGTNPSGLKMHLYVPDRVPSKPALLVVNHWCTGSGPAVHSGTDFATLADQYGYIVVYPSAVRSGSCFDVSSSQALTRGGGSDPVSIMSMVDHVRQRYGVDPDRIFATGISSGAMMTNVLLALYPDVFTAGAAFAGVPYSCFATTDSSGWNTSCAQGQIDRSPQAWGDAVRNAYPGFSGTRPRMQIWHGTNDDALRYPNFQEQIDQWTNVHGLGTTPTASDTPAANWNRTRYGGTTAAPLVEGISIQNGPHNIYEWGMGKRALDFFGLTGSSPSSPPPSSPGPNGACRVAYSTNAWSSGFTASVTITNLGSTDLNGWTLAFTLPSGQTVTNAWNATVTTSGGRTTATNASYNGSLAPDGTASFGFNASHSGNTAAPTAFTLNGAACT